MENTISSPIPSDPLNNFKNPRYRHALVESYISDGIAFQLRAMRTEAQFTQGDVAEKLGNSKLQPVISRYENPDYGKYSLSTLLRLAKLFDVALVVRFEPFSKFIQWHRQSQNETLAVPNFEKELQQGAMESVPAPIALIETQRRYVFLESQRFYRPTKLVQKAISPTDIPDMPPYQILSEHQRGAKYVS